MKTHDRKNSVQFYNTSESMNISAVHGENVVHGFPRHAHDVYCIGYVHQGSRIIRKNGVSTVIPESGLFVINPGEAHECSSLNGAHTYSVICTGTKVMDTLSSQISGKDSATSYFRDLPVHDNSLQTLFLRFFSVIKDSPSILERDEALLALLSTLVLRHSINGTEPKNTGLHDNAMTRVREFITENYARDHSLKQLSRIACLSPFYFQRMFLETTGVSPHDYLVQQRIRKAREFLAAGSSLAQVAQDTGFADQSHFTRIFKRLTGITPGAFCRSIR